jgi:outer membrane protein, multidrug efflux system
MNDNTPHPNLLPNGGGSAFLSLWERSKVRAGARCTVMALAICCISGCTVGPDYQPPHVSIPGGWKETAATRLESPIEKWWTVFNDTTLNELEEKAVAENQELKQSMARVEEARSLARVSAAEFYPELDANPSYRRERLSGNRANPAPFPIQGMTINTFRVPFDLSYEIDIWGRVRRSFEASQAEAQASLAVRRTLLLTLTSDVAYNYFQIRSLDSQKILADKAIAGRHEIVDLLKARADAGLMTHQEVELARVDLAETQTNLPQIIRQRKQHEHALAVLCGKPASEFDVAVNPLDVLPPSIPPGLPSEILMRRPDLLEAERLIAANNARIGVATAAFLPSIRLTGSAGFESAELSTLFDWQSRIWSYGPSVTVPIFQGGRNQANLEASKARYEQAVAEFRQRVLVAFQEVEDSLANIRLRSEEAEFHALAVKAAKENVTLGIIRYENGLTNYLEVLNAEETLLQTQKNAIQTLGQRMGDTVLLIKALGGGWEKIQESGIKN